ncbi:hypothetical protein MMC30_004305 [Trapelia coarctata]|nr:hypothetical protein [Trapelia coarctata]
MESPSAPTPPSLDTSTSAASSNIPTPTPSPSLGGYLDTVLSVFERHSHPFVLVGAIATRWCGLNTCPDEIDVLVRSSQMTAIVDDLIASGEWGITNNRAERFDFRYESYINDGPIKDVWLESCKDRGQDIADWTLNTLRFWPEELYQLSVECNKLEVPDVDTPGAVLLEEEYYRDSYQRFGPKTPSMRLKSGISLLRPPGVRAKAERQDIPIFVPTIEEHLNAVLDQLRKEHETKQQIGNAPEHQIRNFVRYLFLDWIPMRDWILSEKIAERNRKLMAQRIGKFRRKLLILYDVVLKQWVYDKMPWELSIRPELLEKKSK